MARPTLTVGADHLVDGAIAHVSRVYADPIIKTGERLSPDLEWQPTFFFKWQRFTKIAVEVSETVFPVILQRKRAFIEEVPFPVCVFSVCPEEEYQQSIDEAKELTGSGFGLITIDAEGRPHVWHEAPPLQQIITRGQYELEIEDLTLSLRRRLAVAYQAYIANPLGGVREITEFFEHYMRRTGVAAKSRGFIGNIDPANCPLDGVLDQLIRCREFARHQRQLYSARGYILERNENHHPPDSARGEARRLRDTRHTFLEGLKQITAMFGANSEIGLKIRL